MSQTITDNQIFGQELDQEDSSAKGAENFCPYEKTPCMCWVGGDCQTFIRGGKCIFKIATEYTEVRKIC